jgi:hypothetical protein
MFLDANFIFHFNISYMNYIGKKSRIKLGVHIVTWLSVAIDGVWVGNCIY